jgi:uncharacterized protein (DUF4415 family)
MKEKIISMPASEVDAKYGKKRAEIKAMLDAAPEFTFEEMGLKPLKGKPVARGLAEFKEYLNRKGQPLVEDPEVSISIRIPSSYATELRATGRGWRNRVGKYIVNGIKCGDLGKI